MSQQKKSEERREERHDERREERHEDEPKPKERSNSLTGPTGKEWNDFQDMVTDWHDWSDTTEH